MSDENQQSPKRKRGRPRKIKPPPFDWREWATDEERARLARELANAGPTT